MSVDSTQSYNQVNGVITALAIVPHNSPKNIVPLKYWLVPSGAKSYTLTSSDLKGLMYNEYVDLYIGTISAANYAANGSNIDIASANSTKLAKLQMK